MHKTFSMLYYTMPNFIAQSRKNSPPVWRGAPARGGVVKGVGRFSKKPKNLITQITEKTCFLLCKTRKDAANVCGEFVNLGEVGLLGIAHTADACF